MEATFNSRPLTYLAADDIQEPLTPAHLLTGHRLFGLPGSQMLATQDVDFMNSSDHSSITRWMEHTQSLLGRFWRRWRNEYLSDLMDMPLCQVMGNGQPHWGTLYWCMTSHTPENLLEARKGTMPYRRV